jgi:2-polyprenyl-3-methyl-5-hydroxy-6-metoxy-1,4-benzoquinol methylase
MKKFFKHDDFLDRGKKFDKKISKIKSENDINWYPYSSISNIFHIYDLFPTEMLDEILKGRKIKLLDIGAADGDMGFFMESLGCDVDFVDNPPTNYNHCLGINKMKELLGSKNNIIISDIDRYFSLDKSYDIVFALGLFYHLKNPMNFLETLSKFSNHLFLSTRVIRQTVDGLNIANSQVAYLVRSDESNNDATNYWMFTPTSLDLILARTGWIIKGIKYLGCIDGSSNPSESDKDERAFLYCERK